MWEIGLTILTVLAGVAALLDMADRLGFIHLPRFEITFRLRKKGSWGQVRRAVVQIISRIHGSKWRPEVTVGIGGSGTVAAALIVTIGQWIPPYHAFVTLDRVWLDENDPNSCVFMDLPADLIKGKNVLLVDSEAYSGATMKTAFQEITKYQPKNIRTAVLFASPATVNSVTYSGHQVRKVLAMPWEWTPEFRNSRKWRRVIKAQPDSSSL